MEIVSGMTFLEEEDKKRLLEIINHYESCSEVVYLDLNCDKNIEFIHRLREILE
jgi:hypothetical protein